MRRIKHHSIKLYLALAVAGMAILYLWPSLVAANPLTAQQHLERAWKLASDIGVYKHRSEIVQTSHPTPRLENAGRSPKIERMITSGFMNIPENEMHLTLEGFGGNHQSVEVKVENGQAYGRQPGTDEWAELDESADVFASGGDPLGFLVAVENVAPANSADLASTADGAYTGYTFDLNGPRYARYMADQMEAELQRRGELPPGMHLGVADQYLDMKAHGEIWLNEAGLPVRQILHMEFPPEQNAYEWYEADITTTYQGWDTGAVEHQIFWAIPRIIENPSILVDDPLSLLPNVASIKPETLQMIGLMFGLGLLLAAFALFVYTHRHSQKMYAGFALAIILSMLVTPLLQSNHVLAFSQRQHGQIAEQEEQQAIQRAVEMNHAKMAESDFDPTIDPLAIDNSQFTIHNSPLFLPQQQEQASSECANPILGDIDCDGVADDDGDGLSDQIEVVKLGTDPNDIDTDGDRISDQVEVEGFSLNGQKWYLDPLNPDSNNDGIQDTFECINLVDITAEGNWPAQQLNANACENTDGDATPDVFDFDNDGDRVPDALDSALNFTGDLSTNTQSELLLDLSNFTTNKTMLVDFQIRPANPDNLWQNNNVFDWPDNDLSGQINRVFSNTFADMSANQNPVAKLSQGDVMLTPMLQIKIANPDVNTVNPAGGLPIDPAFNGVDIATAVFTDWVDIDMMNQYAISISEDESDGSLYAYVPLAQVTDPVGDTPAAWSAQMVYRPEMANWGQAHEVKLFWTVLALTDTCDTSGLPNPDNSAARAAWCADYSNWVTNQSIIQTYYEDFTLTGLTVTENHGTKTAVVAQTDALAPLVNYESHLWQLVRGLQSTFIVADQLSPGIRFSIEEIKNRFDKDTTPYSTGAPELWDIPDDKLVVLENSAVDPVTAFRDLQTSVPALLDSTYLTPSTGDAVTLLFAQEDTTRSATIEDPDLVTINNNAISIDFSNALLSTYANLNWKPYQRGTATWQAYDVVDYLINELEPAIEAELNSSALQKIVADQAINNEEAAKNGAAFLAQNYYLTFYRGLADLVEIEGLIVGEDIVNNLDFGLDGDTPVTLIIADMIDLLSTLIESEQAAYDSGTLVANSNFEALQLRSFLLENASYGDAIVGVLIADATGTIGGAALDWGLKKVYKRFNKFSKTTPTYGKWLKRGGTVLSTVSAGTAVAGAALLKDDNWKRAALLSATSFTVTAETLAWQGAASKVDLLKQLKNLSPHDVWAKSGATVWDQMQAVKRVVKVSAFTGFLIESGVAVGFFFVNLAVDDIKLGSVQANLLASETIGQVIVAIISAAISATGVGAVIVAIFALIDAAIGFFCELFNVDPESAVRQWVCGGFSGAIAQGISYLIYDNFIPYDVNNKDRLAVTYDMGLPINNIGIEGFVVGNSIQIGANVANTITVADPDRVIIKTSYKDDKLLEVGKTSTFEYNITANPPAEDADNSLSLNGTTWQGNTATFTPTSQVILTEGVNSFPKVYLSELYNLATIECWGFIGANKKATCNEDVEFKGANNTPIGSAFMLDVLPNAVEGLPAFFRNAHPQLDSDGDGLLSKGSGLIDPDDTKWDTDNDGLSDFWEMNNSGFDPEKLDSDDDGLNDYWEALHGTRANSPDSDSDGLQDGDELYHSNARSAYVDDNFPWSGGWTVVYDYNGSQQLQALVSADPLDRDSDRDTILDGLERAYGYHPNLPSVVNILTLNAGSDATVYLPNSTINYTATVKNELDNRVAYGLLETEFPIDVVQSQQTINALYPAVETNLSGSLTAPNTSQSLAQDLVIRGGALIDGRAVDEIFVLPFNETGSATTFLDATSAGHDFICITCPTANSGFATFDGTQTLTHPHDDDFNLTTFSLAVRVRPTPDGGVIYDDVNDFKVEQLSDRTVQATFDGTTLSSTLPLVLDRWNYVVVAYDGSDATIFINSIESGSATVGTIIHDDSDVEIGSAFQGDIDRVALHANALTQDDIIDVFNGLTMHASFDDGTLVTDQQYCGFTDAVTQRSFACHAEAARDEVRLLYGYLNGDDELRLRSAQIATFAPNPNLHSGVSKKAVGLSQFVHNAPPLNYSTRNGDDEYVHFDHEVALAGTSGENLNAFSIGLWLHAAHPYYHVDPPIYPGPLPQSFIDEPGAILTLPDQPGIDPSPPSNSYFTQSTNPMWYTPGDDNTPGDGDQVRIEALADRKLRVTVGGDCTAVINEFMYKGHKDGQDLVSRFGNGNKHQTGNHWQHLVVAYNGKDRLNLYQNGALVSSTLCATNVDFRTVQGFTLGYSTLRNSRGQAHLSPPRSFLGYADDLRFYNRSFTAEEARALYLNTNVQFNFNGRTGQTFFENDSPSGSFGTCSGASCPESGLPGLDNQSVRFDGNDVIELSDDAQAMGLYDRSFTIMGWVKGTGSLLGVQPDGNNNWLFAGVSGNKPKIYWTGTTGAEAAISLDPSQWNHLAFRYQDNDVNDVFLGEIKIYVNGVLATTTTNHLSFKGDGLVHVGQSQGGNFTGMMDNVVVAGYALSDAEIEAAIRQAPMVNLHLDEGLENVLQSFTSFSDEGVLGLGATCDGDACPVAGSRGQMREALVFDGDDMLTIPHSDAMRSGASVESANYTVGMWVKPQQEKDGKQTLAVKGSDSNTEQYFGLFINPNSMKVEFSTNAFCDNAQLWAEESLGSLNKDQWNHVMMTSQYSTAQTPSGWLLKLYLNGALQGEMLTAFPCGEEHPIRIGDSPAAAGFEGSIDEVTFYNNALDAGEIEALYTYQSSWYDTTVHKQILIDVEQPQVDLGDSSIFLNQETRLISFSAYDPSSGIDTVSVQITDPQNGVTTPDATPSAEPNSATWFYNFSPNQSGRYIVQVTATDNLGYVKTVTQYIDVDTVAPGASLTSSSYDTDSEYLILSGTVFDVGSPASGVATGTMTVDVRDRNGNSISGFIAADVAPNGDWSVNYPFPAIPYGEFSAFAVVADAVGNTYQGAISNGTFSLKEIGPIADVVIDTDILGSSIPEIRGTVSDFGYLLTRQQTVFHFEEALDATEFIDGSVGQVVATCVTSDCPAADFGSRYSKGVLFDGLDDLLELGTAPAISGTQAFAVSAWINTQASSEQVIIQQRSVSASDGQYQLSLNPDGTVKWALDGSDGPGFAVISTETVNNNQWRHILGLREADGTARLFIDGVEDGASSSTSRTLLEAPVFIGGDGIALDKFFDGVLDEVTIYAGAPTADEVYYMANPLDSTITDIQVRFRSFEPGVGQVEGPWNPADFSQQSWFTTWSLDVPSLSSDLIYKIDLLVTDSHGNTRYIGDAWTGGFFAYDLQISAEADVSSVEPGDQITYTAAYTNSATSSSSVPGVELTLTVPPNMIFNAGLNDPSWNCIPDTSTGSICTYPVGELTLGESGVTPVMLDVLNQIPAGVGTVSATLTIGPLSGEQAVNDNTTTVTTPITGTWPELTVIKSTQGITPTPGSNLEYTITVTNSGNLGTDVVLTETVPSNVLAALNLPGSDGWQCDAFGAPGETCVFSLGNLPAGDVATTTFILRIDNFIPDNTIITNTIQVAVAGDTPETDLSDNIFQLVTPVDTSAEPVLFSAALDQIIIQEGQVATNTMRTPCDPDPPGQCEIDASASIGGLPANPGDPEWNTPGNFWVLTDSDGPDDTGTVTVTYETASGTVPVNFELVVENVIPTITLTGSDNAEIGTPYTLTLGDVVDPGDDTVTACTVNWGDGNSADCLSAISGGSLNHTYATSASSQTITVDLTDEDGLHLAAGSKIVSFAENTEPVFATIDPQTVAEGETLTFTAVATDAEGAPLTYSLQSGPMGATVDPNTGLFTWITDENDGPGVYPATLVVSDGVFSVTTDSLITVSEVNVAPVFATVSDPMIDEGGTVNLFVSASDSDLPAQTLTYSLGEAPTGAIFNVDTGLFSWTSMGEADGPGVYPATILVSDGVVTSSQQINITVNEVNEAPILDPIAGVTISAGETATFTATASDADLPTQTLIYSLENEPAGATIDPNTGVFSWDSVTAGLYTVKVIVSDGNLSDSQNVAIIVGQGSVAPQFFPVTDQTVSENNIAQYVIDAYDANGDTLAYSLSHGPSGATVDPVSGLFTWLTDEVDGPGVYPITVVASDGALTDSITINITVTEDNLPPVLDPIADQIVGDGETLSFTATANDADIPAQTLTYGLSDAPAGATIDSASGLFNWVADGIGVYNATISVSDGVVTTSQLVTLTVTVGNLPPVLDPIANPSVDEGATVSFTATASDDDTLTYSLSNAPAGATIGETTGLFEWATTEADGPGVYSATVVVSDGSLTDEQVVEITVNEVNVTPVLDPISDQAVTEGETVSFTATANDTDEPAQTLSFSLSNAPAEASINSNGAFSWVTDENDGPGVYNATVIVSDGTLTDSQTIAITVNEETTAPVLDPIAPQTIAETETLTFTATAVDPDNDALTYGLYNASSGMSIDSSTGEFSWTPTEAQGPAAYFFSVMVTDTTGLTDTTVAMVNVTEVNQAPGFDPIAAQTLPKTQPFSLMVNAVDDDYPANGLSYTMINAPDGAALDESSGLFSWTPEDTQGPAEYTITFVVTDDGTPVLSDTQDVTFTVTNNPGVLITESDGSTDVAFGGYDTYEMVLIAQPTDTVTVTMSTDGQVETIPTRLVFTPDNWDEPQMVSTNAMDDVVYEGPHTGLISHSASSDDPGYDGIGIADVIVNIADDTEDLPVITIGDVTVDENVGTAIIPVTLTGESVFATEVSFEVSDGTALGSGIDYDATNGTLTWAANTNGVQTINITIVNDTDEEPAETINVALTDVMSGTIDDGNAVVTISANDEPVPEPLLSITKDVTTVNDPVKPGDVVTYTISVSNSGEGVAEDVTVQDTLPTYLSGTDLDQTVTISANEEIAFTVVGTVDSNIPVGLTTITNTASFSHSLSDGQASATIVVSKTVEPEPSDLLYLSARRNGSVDGLSYADEDILVYDPDADTWAKLFDGSDVGYRGADIDAFTILEDGSLLLSADRNRNLDGLGRVDDSDIVRFIPTSLGENTVGTFEWYFDASDVRLTRGGEDVDAISVTSEGKLLISTIGSFRVAGIGGRDEDLILFTPTSLGENTSGTWERYFDGSDVGLRSWREDVRGGQIDEATGDIYLTTDRRFDVPGLEGEGTDIFVCSPTSLGVNTACEFSLYWAGEEYGFDRDIDAFAIGGEVAVEVTATTIALADIEEADSPEEEDRAEDDEDNEDDTDEIHDLDDTSLGIEAGTTTLFLPIVAKQ